MTSCDKPLSNHDKHPHKNRDPQTVDMTFEVDTTPVRELVDDALAEVQFAQQLLKDVTRFALHPDCRVNHPAFERDMRVVDVKVIDGVVMFQCHDELTEQEINLPLGELWPAGAATDATREMVRVMIRAYVEDTVAQLIDAGALRKPDPSQLPAEAHPDWQSGAQVMTDEATLSRLRGNGEGGGAVAMERGGEFVMRSDQLPNVEQIVAPAQSETTHHLGCHPEYVMDPKGPGTTPAGDKSTS